MKEHEARLHLSAIVPPLELEQKIDAIRREFSESFQCYKALRPPVHLTLYKPFNQSDEKVAEHIDTFRREISGLSPFIIELDGFGFFEKRKSPVVFIEVVNHAALAALNAFLTEKTKAIFGLSDQPSDSRFHPHFTIAYRDVSPGSIPAIKQSYGGRSFHASFEVRQVTLFRHNGQRWERRYKLPLAESA